MSGGRVSAVLLMLLSVSTSIGLATGVGTPSEAGPCTPSDDPPTSEVLDDFEYTDTPFEHGWAKESWVPGTFNTTSDNFKHGGCSLLVGGGVDMDIVRTVNLSQDYRLTAWFYDSLYPDTRDYGVLLSLVDPNYKWDRGLGLTWRDSNFYIYSNVIDGAQAEIYSTSIARRAGWHGANYERVGDTLNRYIDDVLVNSTNVVPGETESWIRLATHAIYSSTHWDYVTFVTSLEVSATANPSTGVEPLAVSLSSTVTGGVSPYSYSWTFGDGEMGSGANPNHTYLAAGTYTTTLVVTDSHGNTEMASASVTVIASLVVTGFSDVSDGTVPLVVKFSVSTSGGTGPYSYSWDFGDGSKSAEQNPTPTFKDARSYSVSVEVKDGSGQARIMTFQIVARENVSPYASPVLPIVGVVAVIVVATMALWVFIRRRK